jgi:putative thioredoxin
LVRTDEEAKARFLEILEAMGSDDPRTAGWRRRLTAQLF